MRGSTACVFCGSSTPASPGPGEAADRLVDGLAGAGCRMVYGGARVGLMGRVADRALERGMEVIGVLPDFLGGKELLHPGLTRVETVPSMHERKARMIELSDFFLVLPGGFGTLDELFDVLTLAQLGAHAKPTGIVDVDGFYAPLRAWMEGALAGGFLRPVHLDLMVVDQDPVRLLERLRGHRMPELPRWVRSTQA